ncbi:MAG: phycobiliprotein lyase [Prochlorococcaceae cyanobacterium]
MSNASSDTGSESSPFPPQEIGAFLRFCAGEWMGLRSQFVLAAASSGDAGDDADDDGWHSSERGELVVTFVEPDAHGSAGSLRVAPKDGVAQQLHFSGDGGFCAGDQQGSWQLWPDGSLELTLRSGGTVLRERIWFTKPNLRLRSSVETRADGIPGRASFNSEIRRLNRPPS